MARGQSPQEVESWFQQQVTRLGPAGLGSLSLRRSGCVRPHCETCRSGVKHHSYVLYGHSKGRRYALYVPDDLVPEVRRMLDHGRRLQDLLQEGAQRYVKALKRQRKEQNHSRER